MEAQETTTTSALPAETASAATTKGKLIEAMIGRGGEALEQSYSEDLMLPQPSGSASILTVDQLSFARSLKDVSFAYSS